MSKNLFFLMVIFLMTSCYYRDKTVIKPVKIIEKSPQYIIEN